MSGEESRAQDAFHRPVGSQRDLKPMKTPQLGAEQLYKMRINR